MYKLDKYFKELESKGKIFDLDYSAIYYNTHYLSSYSLLTNDFKYGLIVACGLKATNSLPVFIQTSAGNVPLLDKFANPVFSNQLKTRTKYCIGYGNQNTNYTLGQFIVFNNLCCSCGSVVATTRTAK